MPKPTREEVKGRYGKYPATPEIIAELVTGLNPDGTRFRLTTERLGENELLLDAAHAFAAGAAVGTIVDQDAPVPARLDPEARYAVIVHNPGGVAVTVRLENREALNGAERLSQVHQFGVAAGVVSPPQIVQGLYLGSGASRVRVSNDALVPAGGGFSVAVRIRRL